MEDITVNTAAGRHRITLDGRKQCKVTGVTDVLSFDEGAVLLETVDGMLMIKGEGLHVSRINLDKGEADIDGKADSFVKDCSHGCLADYERYNYQRVVFWLLCSVDRSDICLGL